MYRRKFSSIVKEYFSFTSGERRGIIVLFVIMLITIGIRIALPYFLENTVVSQVPHKAMVENEAKDSIAREFPPKDMAITMKDHKHTYHKRIVEINSCDTAALEGLPGIGSVFSRRILKYRGSLGGYCAKSQLLEVFGMTAENYNRFIGYVAIDTLKIRRLDVNKATFKEMNAHPYISFEQTKAICRLRSKYLKLNRDHILHCEAFDSIQKIKVLTYLKFD